MEKGVRGLALSFQGCNKTKKVSIDVETFYEKI